MGLGLRQSEIFGLSPKDVDLERGDANVLRQVKIFYGNTQILALPRGHDIGELEEGLQRIEQIRSLPSEDLAQFGSARTGQHQPMFMKYDFKCGSGRGSREQQGGKDDV